MNTEPQKTAQPPLTEREMMQIARVKLHQAVVSIETQSEWIEDVARRLTHAIEYRDHKLDQIQIHLKTVVSGKNDGKEIAQFLLNEFFK